MKKQNTMIWGSFFLATVLLTLCYPNTGLGVQEIYWTDTSNNQISHLNLSDGEQTTLRVRADIPANETLKAFHIIVSYPENAFFVVSEDKTKSDLSDFFMFFNFKNPGEINFAGFSPAGFAGGDSGKNAAIIDFTIQGKAGDFGNMTITADDFGESAAHQFIPEPVDVVIGAKNGFFPDNDLWIRAVIHTEDKGPIEARWQMGGTDTTARGDKVIWGYFYADPHVMSWGSRQNPDIFVKIWKDVSGPVYVNYFHVSVPDIDVYTDYPFNGTPDQQDTATLTQRFVEHYYVNGQSGSRVKMEDGNPPAGYDPSGNPQGTELINSLRIGSMIKTEDKGPIEGVWRLGGQDTTARGDQVVWGHFYADPNIMSWGSPENPDLFVKIWFDVTGPVFVDFFHVSVPDIEVYSDLPTDGHYDQKGTTILDNRFVEHRY